MDSFRKGQKIPQKLLLAASLKMDELAKLLEPSLVSLSSAERKALGKTGAESIEFLELSYGISLGNPELFPPFLKLSSFEEKFISAYELSRLLNKIDNLRNGVCDTKDLIGNHAMENALAFYNTVRIAARRDIPGAGLIYEELKAAFPPRRKQ